jgi:hypothetical protein
MRRGAGAHRDRQPRLRDRAAAQRPARRLPPGRAARARRDRGRPRHAENILERITFYDIDSRRIGKYLTEEERILYLKEIKADISHFKRSYERADLQVTITGLDPEASAAAIDARLGRT